MPKVVSACVVAIALVTGWAVSHRPVARYAVAAANGVAWRLDTTTGETSMCRVRDWSESPVCTPFGADRVPVETSKADETVQKLVDEATR